MKKLLILSVLLTCWQYGMGQQVSGTIMDGTLGEALIGATILEKGTDNGTITDLDGGFTLAVSSENPVLEISYIGYKTQEIAYDGTPINVSLFEDAQTLDEIVVVGYGTQKKKVVTGSIAKVNGEELEDKQVTRLEQALQGRSAGVTVISGSGQPGSGGNVRIRGVGTTGNSDPLYVVDGVLIGGGIDYLNSDDIESIEVLKDASAGIYGVQAAGGVILVTTKKGSPGMRLTYESYLGFQNAPRKLAVLNATEYGIISNEASVASGGPILFDDPLSLGEGTDWQDAIFRDNAPMVSHNFSLSAGSKKSKYFASLAYFNQQGIVSQDKSNYERFNLRFNSTHEITKRLTFNNSIAYARVKASGVSVNDEFGSPIARAVNLDPLTPIYETDSMRLSSPVFTNNAVVKDEEGTFGISQNVSSEILNPLAALEVQNGIGWSDKIVSSAYLEYEFIDGLKFKTSFGADLAFWGNENFSPVHYLNATNRLDINSYSRGQNRGLSWIFENTLAYDKIFGSHEFGLVVGTSATKNKGQGIGGSIRDIPVQNFEEASLGFATTGESQSFGGFEYEDRLASTFGRINYNYAERYLFTAILRRDGSTTFGPDKKWGYFPSLLVGWNVSDENFFNNSGFVKYLKLRASWGESGNSRIGAFRYLPLIATGANYTIGENDDLIIGSVPGALANPTLGWETTTKTNLGFDAKLLDNISLTVDVYRENTRDILQINEAPGFVGFPSPFDNIAQVDNEGIEIELGYEKDFGDFKLNFFANGAYNRNELIFLNNDKDFQPGQRVGPQGLEVTRFTVGQPIGHLYGYRTDGIFQNQAEVDDYVNNEGEPLLPDAVPGDIRFVDFNEDGIVDENDRTFIGDGNPTWSYGLTLEMDWKGFDFRIFGQGIAGNEISNITRRFDLVGANYSATVLNRWTGEGTSNFYPRVTQDDRNRNFSRSSDFYVENGSFFKLRNVQLGYKLSDAILEKLNIGDTRIYFSANNLFTFTDYTGFDPEIVGGIDRGQYPNPRTFVFGINTTLVDKKNIEK